MKQQKTRPVKRCGSVGALTFIHQHETSRGIAGEEKGDSPLNIFAPLCFLLSEHMASPLG